MRVRLIEIGEAVKALPEGLLASEPALPWAQIAGMRDRLTHRYFDTSHAVLAATVSEDLPDLEAGVLRLLNTVDDDGARGSPPVGHVRVTTGTRPGLPMA